MKNPIIFLTIFYFLYALPTYAGVTIANFSAVATINPYCSVSAPTINFGTVQLSTTASGSINSSFSAARVKMLCSNNVAYRIFLSSGSSGTYSQRTMVGQNSNNKDTLDYNIYNDDGNGNSYNPNLATSVWGDGTQGTGYYSATSDGTVHTWSPYIYFNPNQYVQADIYTDNVIVTISY